MRLIVPDKFVKFRDPCLSRSREKIPPETVGCGIFLSFRYNFRPEVDNDVISGMAGGYVGNKMLRR